MTDIIFRKGVLVLLFRTRPLSGTSFVVDGDVLALAPSSSSSSRISIIIHIAVIIVLCSVCAQPAGKFSQPIRANRSHIKNSLCSLPLSRPKTPTTSLIPNAVTIHHCEYQNTSVIIARSAECLLLYCCRANCTFRIHSESESFSIDDDTTVQLHSTEYRIVIDSFGRTTTTVAGDVHAGRVQTLL